MTRLGIISDVHAVSAPVEEALSIFSKAGVEQVYCAGDIAGYNDELLPTIKLLQSCNCKTIMGNHDLSYLDQQEDESDDISISYLKTLPDFLEENIEGKSIYMVHAQPPDGCHGGIKLLDKNAELITDKMASWTEMLRPFDYDVLIVGHTHQVFVQVLGNTLVVNPGSTAFNNCCAILTLPEMTVELIALSGKAIEKTWNWGEHVIYGR